MKPPWNAKFTRFLAAWPQGVSSGPSMEFTPLRPGTLIAGAYRVTGLLAEGGMGLIYEAEQVATGARRALKVMHGRFAADDDLRSRFVREARVAASIPSDHVAQVLDGGLDAGTGVLFIVMELLEGQTLSQELRRRGPFGWIETLAVLGQIAHALGAAHALGIVHRDLKPANVFLAQSRHAGQPVTVKVLDFGIAKAIAGAGEATQAVLGTPTWMAPEQTNVGAPIGPEADVWSFGLVAFMVLTGRHYFASANVRGAGTAAVLREVVLEPLAPSSQRATEMGYADRLPRGFDEWFARCVHRTPEERFPDVRQAFEALAALPPPEILEAPSSAIERLRAKSAISVPTPITAIETPHPSRVSRRLRQPGATAAMTTGEPPPNRRGPRPSVIRLGVAGGIGVAFVALLAWGMHVHDEPPPPVPSAATTAAMPTPTSSAEIRLHGSNTIGAELAPAVAQAFLQRRTGARAVVRRRTGPDEVSVEARDGERTLESVEIFAHGTKTAFDDLHSGACDLGMASRPIHDDEIQSLTSLGNMASAASENVIALDGIAVIVNPANPVTTLTTAQIGALFSGRIRRWSEVGGQDQPVVVHARDDKSGTYDTFRHLVLVDSPLIADAKRHESSEELSDAVAGDARAVGFIGLPYVRSAKALMVQAPGTVPLLPSPLTVATEDYPLARRLYLYLPAQAPVVARDYVDFALSEDGQRVVRSAGFVDLLPTCEPAPPRCTSCPRPYLEAIKGACRVTIDFRFDRSGGQLDTRALRDLTRVGGMMSRPDYSGRGLVLIGFSDRGPATADNVASSQRRATMVAEQLRARGLHVAAEVAMGAEMPIDDDATDEGRQRNRRVEIWLR
jgi:phosphate transport system substrate-binding protein